MNMQNDIQKIIKKTKQSSSLFSFPTQNAIPNKVEMK